MPEQRCILAIPLLACALVLFGRVAAAQGSPDTDDRSDAPARTDDEPAAKPIGSLLAARTREAGSAQLIEVSARPYAEARKLLARGQPAAALKALAKSTGDLFADREALVRGDALLALGDQKKAKEAYLTALEQSQSKAISIAAARSMINVLGLLRERDEELRYIDALLDEPRASRRASLLLQRALVLRDLDRPTDAADYAWRVVRDYPAEKISLQANTLLKELKRRGVKVPVPSSRIDLARLRSFVQSGEYRRADAEMTKLEKAQPGLKRAIDLLRAESFRRRRMRDEEYQILARLYKAGGPAGDDDAEILWRLGRLALAKDDNGDAIKFFDELEAKYPNHSETPEAQYLAAWIPYSAGDFDAATDRMLRFASTYRKSPNRSEALWFAGWSAYLAKKDGISRRALEQLLEEHPQSDLRTQARYSIGRLRQRAGEKDTARAAYREVLSQSPLSYWGFWSTTRLKELGEEVVLKAPPATSVSALSQVIAMLGPRRPIAIDRAIALHAADLKDDALDELQAANDYLRSIRDTLGRTMIADLLHTLGAHYLAYKVGSSIAQDGADLVTGKPYAWRAWRHAYPRAFEKEVAVASTVHDIDMDLVLSIMRTESSFRVNVRSPVGAYGLMQLMPTTAAQIGRTARDGRAHAARFKNPESNVWLGSWYLARLVKRYGGQLAPAIGAYNAGPGAMDKWVEQFGGSDLDEFIERIPYRETRRYVRRVLETYMVYRRLNGEPALDLNGKVRGKLDAVESVNF